MTTLAELVGVIIEAHEKTVSAEAVSHYEAACDIASHLINEGVVEVETVVGWYDPDAGVVKSFDDNRDNVLANFKQAVPLYRGWV